MRGVSAPGSIEREHVTTLFDNDQWQKAKDAAVNVQHNLLSGGFVTLIDCMGGDQDIVDAARTSFGRGTKRLQADDKLIRYLMRHRHTTPFEMCEFKFLIQCPFDLWRQWIRHRMASVNEYSTRYSEALDLMDTTDENRWRQQSDKNKQGSGEYLNEWPEGWSYDREQNVVTGEVDGGSVSLSTGEDVSTPGLFLSYEEQQLHKHAVRTYRTRLAMGVAREQARKDLPLSNYTRAYWKIDLHNLLHFLSLRMHPHAQQEIRSYAGVIFDICKAIVPVTMKAFEDYRLNSVTLSALDADMIRMLSGHTLPVSYRDFMLRQIPEWSALEKCREREECLEKLVRLGLVEL